MATLPSCVGAEALLDLMKSSTLTDGWDAVVSYTLERFNPFLQNWVRSASNTTPFKFNIDDHVLGKKYSVNLQLGELDPSWKVEGNILYAVFNIPIDSCDYWISAGTTTEDFENDNETEWRSISPKGFNLELKVHQEHISGRYYHGAEQIKSIPRDDSQFFTFGAKTFEGKDVNDVVVQEFGRGPLSSWSINANPDSPFTSADEHFLTMASKKILLWFYSTYPLGFRIIYNEWDNYISWSGDKKTPVPFTPEHFVVTATGCDRGGIISIWIKIAESGNGAGSPRPVSKKVSPDGKTSGQQLCLLPSTKWTSLVFGRQFFLGNIIYNKLHAAINKPTPTEILNTESGFSFNFQYGEDKIHSGVWIGNAAPRNESHNVEQFNNKTYHFDIDIDGKIKVHRLAECYKDMIVTLKLELSKSFDADSFRVRDMHIIRPYGQIVVAGSDIRVGLKDVHWLQSEWSPVRQPGWQWFMDDFAELKIDFPAIGLRPFCNLLAALLSRNTNWDNALKFPYDAVLFGDLVNQKPLKKPDKSPAQPKMPLQPLKGTELGYKRKNRRRGMLEKLLHADLEDPEPVHYFEPFFANEELLLLFLLSAAKASTTSLPAIAKKYEMAFPAPSVKDVTKSLLISPDFDARLIAGTYQIDKPASFQLATIFIDTMSEPPKAWINDHQATSATVMEDGCHFAFTIETDISELVNGTSSGDKPMAAATATITAPAEETKTQFITITYAMAFYFPFNSPNEPITFIGTVSAPATETLPAEVQTFGGYQIPSNAYREVAIDPEGATEWGLVKYLAAEYCLYGVLVWICANSFRIVEPPNESEDPVSVFEIPRTSEAWRRLNSFVGFWKEQKIAEVGDLIVAD